MSYEPSVHEAQSLILRHLLFVPKARFSELQKSTQLTSDHFTFHIKKLLTSRMVEKIDDAYRLSPKGKEYANRMDTDDIEIERQPKVSVALVVERHHNGERQFLAQQRLKQPYYGFWGRMGGKVRWGESLEEAAARELKEESGLDATFTYKMLFHKRDYKKSDGSLLEDKLFAIMYTNQTEGNLVEQFEGGINRWMTQEEFMAQEKTFESARDFINLLDNGVTYHAQEYTYDESEY